MNLHSQNTRSSNMEALRLLSMFFVLALHANYFIWHAPTARELASTAVCSFLRVFAEAACIVAVNVFVLISGWFGIKPTFRGLATLLFQVMFASFASFLIALIFLPEALDLTSIFNYLWFGGSRWFVPAYLTLFLLAAPLNSFIENGSEKQLRRFIVAFYLLVYVYGYFVDCLKIDSGYSGLAFIGLYALARYVRLYAHEFCNHSAPWFFGAYLALTICLSLFACLAIIYRLPADPFSYLSPLVILSALSLLLAFSKLSFQSKAVNWLAASCFAIYLIHTNPLLVGQFISLCKKIWRNADSIPAALALTLLYLLAVGFACILIDKVRLLLWRKLCRRFSLS